MLVDYYNKKLTDEEIKNYKGVQYVAYDKEYDDEALDNEEDDDEALEEYDDEALKNMMMKH